MYRLLSFLFALLIVAPAAAVSFEFEPLNLQSPDGRAQLSVTLRDDYVPTYSLTVDGTCVLRDSRIEFDSLTTRFPRLRFIKVSEVEQHRGEWHPLWGKRAVVRDDYNEATITLGCMTGIDVSVHFNYTFRLYNDGMAWRCQATRSGLGATGELTPMGFPKTGGVTRPFAALRDVSTFSFADDYTAWYYNGEYHNIGPELLSESEGIRRPVVTIKANDNLYLALHEALLLQGKPLLFHTEKGSTSYRVVSDPEETDKIASTAWRVVMYGRTPGELVDSHIIELLNPDPDPQYDFGSWVHPGVNLWDWRIDGALWPDSEGQEGEPFAYGMNFESWVRMVDFAAEQGFTGLVLDANWYGPEFEKDSDPITGEKARDVQRIIRYGKERGVGLWLYLNDVAGTNYPIEETLAQYEAWGAAGVKYGFMEGTMTERNVKTMRITELCAKHHLCVDFHDNPVHPWGQARTWPNALTREYCQAQLDAHRTFEPKTFVTSVFVNMLAGPLDMNNGFFDLRMGPTTRVDNNQEVHSTVCGEAARVFITYSGADVMPDIPEYYRQYPDLVKFLSAQRQPWLDSRTLDGQIGEYIVMMRKARDGRYLIGAATNEEARTLTVDLSFLPRGKYVAEISEDHPDTHYLNGPRHTRIQREVAVNIGQSPSTITLNLAPGGGACVYIRSEKER